MDNIATNRKGSVTPSSMGRKRRASQRPGGYVPLMARRGSALAGIQEEKKIDAKKQGKIQKVTREVVRREGKVLHGDKSHGRKASGIVQVVQEGSKYYIKVTNLEVENEHDVDLHFYLLRVKAKPKYAERLERNGFRIPIPNGEKGLFKGV